MYSIDTLKRINGKLLWSKGRGSLLESRCWLHVDCSLHQSSGSMLVIIWKCYGGTVWSNSLSFSRVYISSVFERKEGLEKCLSVLGKFLYLLWILVALVLVVYFVLQYLVWIVHQMHWYCWVGAPKLPKCVFQKALWWKFSAKWKSSVTA